MSISTPYTNESAVELIAPELSKLTAGVISSLITEADGRIEIDISPVISAADLHALSAIPAVVSNLSMYLTRAYGYKKYYANRTDNPEGDDLHKYWLSMYEITLRHILDGNLAITDSTGAIVTSTSYTYNKASSLKTLGTGEWGEYVEGVDG